MPDRYHFPPVDPRNLVVNVLRTDDLLALQFEGAIGASRTIPSARSPSPRRTAM
jgi:hypothetical protein